MITNSCLDLVDNQFICLYEMIWQPVSDKSISHTDKDQVITILNHGWITGDDDVFGDTNYIFMIRMYKDI